MSKYTTEVRFICETEAGLSASVGFNSIDNILNVAAPKIFNFDFPIYDESYRLVLEKQILRHYYTREIGMETVGLWKLKLQDRLNLIMPKYNKLYESALIEFNPLYDVDLTTDHNKGNVGTSNSSMNSTRKNNETGNSSYNKHANSTDRGNSNETHNDTDSNTHWDLYSDTPQGGVQGINNATDPSLANNAYLTNARKITDNGTNNGGRNINNSSEQNGNSNGSSSNSVNQTITDNGTSTGNINNTETYIEHVKGKRSGITYGRMIKEYRESLISIDQMIVNELSDLFFGLWE